jgi:hypothetical protein
MRLGVWCSLEEWELLTAVWVKTKFEDVDAELLKTKCEYYTKVFF